MLNPANALVLHSGGQDSTTCLAWALERFNRVETIGFNYGQRHSVEMECRLAIRERLARMNPEWAKRLGEDHIVDLGILGEISETALTRESEIALTQEGLPTTFVPGRNLAFLTFAAVVAYRRGAKNIVAGVCETDYSGYPDCRDDTVKALQLAVNLGMARQFTIHTPLMWLDKAATWELANNLGGNQLVDAIIDDSHTCYKGERVMNHAWGKGCGTCPACQLREEGFVKFSNARKSLRGLQLKQASVADRLL